MGLFDRLKRKRRRRAVVVGLDGVPFTLLEDLKQRNIIPNMSAIFENGYFGQMAVSIPEISSVSWSSFMTGKQPGEHGIFGFIDLEPGTYNMFFPNYLNLKAETLWDDLSTKGKKSVVINMPATYPARKIEGALISGFVAIDINKAVYPRTLIPKLNDLNYRIDIDTAKARHDHELLFRDLNATLNGRMRALDLLWQEIDWDLFVVVITGTDRLMHFLWSAYENMEHPHHQDFMDYFAKVDSFIGQIFDRFQGLNDSNTPENHFCMLSDHGFTKIKAEVYLNHWLQQNGYLKFKSDQPQTIMDIGPGSVAFTLDPSRIYINLKDKYPYGKVENADYDRVRQEIKNGIETLAMGDGNLVAKQVYYKEELYHGPNLNRAPDLVVLSEHGYDLKGKVNSPELFGSSGLQGMHTQDDAFFYSNHGLRIKSIFEAKNLLGQLFSTD